MKTVVKTDSSKSLFLLFKKEIVGCEVGLFASLLCVKCKDVTLKYFFFYIFKTIFTETIIMKSSVKRELLSLCCGV